MIFSEAQFNDALVQAIAADAGAIVVNDLYDDTLGDPPADTYAGMMSWNADRVIEAVSGQADGAPDDRWRGPGRWSGTVG